MTFLNIRGNSTSFGDNINYIRSLHTFYFIRNSVLVPVLKVTYKIMQFLVVKMEFKSINYDLKNNGSSHPQNSNKKLGNIQEEAKKYI